MRIDFNLLCAQSFDLMTIKKLLKRKSKDASEVENFTKKFGLGTPEWQNAMVKRVKEKIKKNKKLTELDKTFIHVQILHNIWVEDQLKSMGIFSTCMN
jgi:hypothetical protein